MEAGASVAGHGGGWGEGGEHGVGVEVDLPLEFGGSGGVGFDEAVVGGAEEGCVGEFRFSAVLPGVDVVAFAGDGWCVAAGEGAAAVAGGECAA